MRKFHSSKRFWAISAGLPFLSATVQALEPSDVLIFSKEPVSLRPQLGITETYNDNIFSQPEGKSDLITTLSPGLKFRLGREAGNFLALDYTFTHSLYLDRARGNYQPP